MEKFNYLSLAFLLLFLQHQAYGIITPKIEIHPRDLVVQPVGSNFTLLCKKAVENSSSGKDKSILIFSSLSENLNGKFTCLARYANSKQLIAQNEVQSSTGITWIDAPEIQYSILDKHYQIKCKVRANPAPTVEWLKNGEIIDFSSSDRYIVENDGLTIKNVKKSDDGIYTCKAVVLSTGEMKYKNIKLEVFISPKINAINSIIEVVEGEEVSVICNGTGNPPPSYTWIKEITPKDPSKNNGFLTVATTGVLKIHNVPFTDSAYYKCIARNPAGESETRIKINVLLKPKIYELLNITSSVNTSTGITCKAFGIPTPKVYFKKVSNKAPFLLGIQLDRPGVVLENLPGDFPGETIGTLKFDLLGRSDDGLYYCIAENSADTSYKTGHITVEFPPTFEKTENDLPVWSWDTHPGNLTCIPESIPNATIKWRHNSVILKDSPQITQFSHGTISSLIVNPINESRFYTTYECVAINKLGSAIKKFELRKATVPSKIQEVTTETVTATTIKFRIVGPRSSYGLPIRSIIVNYRTERDMAWSTSKKHVWSFNSSYILENLIPEEIYIFRFAAKNDVGISVWEGEQRIKMPKRSIPVAPKFLLDGNTVNFASSEILERSKYGNHYTLKWTVPYDNGDPIDYYMIQYCMAQNVNGQWIISESECNSKIEQNVLGTDYKMSSLMPETTYKVELRAHNAIGFSMPAEIIVKTAPVKPVLEDISDGHITLGEKLILKCTVRYVNQFSIDWNVPNKDGIKSGRINLIQITRTENEDEFSQNLEIQNTTIADQGDYTCIVNSGLHINNDTKFIRVFDYMTHHINFTKENGVCEKLIKTEKSNVQWRINIDTNSTTKLIWYDNNGKEIQTWLKPNENPKYAIETEGEKYTILKIYNITIFDWGYYKLDAISDFGNKSFELFLNVTAKPSVDMEPKDFYQVDEISTLNCRVAAYPEASIDWLYKPCLDASCNFNRIASDRIITRGFLKIAYLDFTARQTGYISCIASNILGVDQVSKILFVTDADTMADKIR